MTEKRDLLTSCVSQDLPLEDLQRDWCPKCLNPTCTRSLSGKIGFDIRTQTWYDRLFAKPARLPPEDPRYSTIVAKNFIEIPTGGPIELRSWVDPLEFEAKVEQVLEGPRPASARKAPPPVPDPEPPAEDLTPEAPQTPPVVTRPNSAVPVAQNTPFQQGRMLGGATPVQAPKAQDTWSAPVPAAPAQGRVVKPGTKIRFGGS